MNTAPHTSDLSLGREVLLAGDVQSAVEALSRAVGAQPNDPEPLYWLASAQMAAGDAGAEATLDAARSLHGWLTARALGVDLGRCRTDLAYADLMASGLYSQKLAATSSVVYEAAVAMGLSNPQGQLNYALALQHQGRIEAACQAFAVVANDIPAAAVEQLMIYPKLFLEGGDARHLAAARAWAKRHVPPRPCPPLANPGRAGRPLRVGYLAPRFAGCQLQQFIAPLLEHHDPSAVSVVLYPTSADTETRWPSWIQVHPTGVLDDVDVAAMIRADGIDVLADCWGHTAGSRITVFAHRAAPVQLSWINFFQTTGMEQADYVLHADGAPPEGIEALYTERIWRIGPVFNAFRPAAGRLAPAPTPALTTGQVTFGSFNHPAKLSDETFDAWAETLRRVPTARLLLKYSYFADPVLRRTTQARMAARGVAPERLAFAGHSSGDAYLESFREVDLMLDTWPAPGSTTTLEALSNGVPVLALAPPSVAGLSVRAMLGACDLPELVCDTPAAFVERAVALASDIPALDRLRARVRPGFDQGPISDEAGFTRRIEAAFAQMFDLWRAQAQSAA